MFCMDTSRKGEHARSGSLYTRCTNAGQSPWKPRGKRHPFLLGGVSSKQQPWAGRRPSHPKIRPVTDTCSGQTPQRLELMGFITVMLRSDAPLWPQRWKELENY